MTRIVNEQRSTTALVEKYIGTAYEKMEALHTNLDALVELSDGVFSWVGTSASEPTIRLDGTALQEGDRYFDTSTDTMMVYVSNAWVDAYQPAVDVTKTHATLANAIADTALVVGQIVKTNGYHTSGDGGGAYYTVRANTYPSDTYVNPVTAGDKVLSINQTYYLNALQAGVKPSGTYLDAAHNLDTIQEALDHISSGSIQGLLYFPGGHYVIGKGNTKINYNNVCISGAGDNTFLELRTTSPTSYTGNNGIFTQDTAITDAAGNPSCIFENFKVSNDYFTRRAGISISAIYGKVSTTIRNVTFICGDKPIRLGREEEMGTDYIFIVDNCRFKRGSRSIAVVNCSINSDYNSSFAQVTNNSFEASTFSTGGVHQVNDEGAAAIDVTAHACFVNNNRIEGGCDLGAINIEGANRVVVTNPIAGRNSIVSSNYIDLTTHDGGDYVNEVQPVGIRFSRTPQGMILNNTIKGKGINTVADSHYATSYGIYTSCQSTILVDHELYLADRSNVLISGNVITDIYNGIGSLEIKAPIANTLITGNRIVAYARPIFLRCTADTRLAPAGTHPNFCGTEVVIANNQIGLDNGDWLDTALINPVHNARLVTLEAVNFVDTNPDPDDETWVVDPLDPATSAGFFKGRVFNNVFSVYDPVSFTGKCVLIKNIPADVYGNSLPNSEDTEFDNAGFINASNTDPSMLSLLRRDPYTRFTTLASADPDPTTVGGMTYRFTDIGPIGASLTSNGAYWTTNGFLDLFDSAVPLVFPGELTFTNTSGAFTLSAGLPTGLYIGYMYLDANVLTGSNTAGFYYFVMSTSNAGILYTNSYDVTNGYAPPYAITSPTAVTGGTAATIAEVIDTKIKVLSAIIPAGLLSKYSTIEQELLVSSSAFPATDSYTVHVAFGATNVYTTDVVGPTSRTYQDCIVTRWQGQVERQATWAKSQLGSFDSAVVTGGGSVEDELTISLYLTKNTVAPHVATNEVLILRSYNLRVKTV